MDIVEEGFKEPEKLGEQVLVYAGDLVHTNTLISKEFLEFCGVNLDAAGVKITYGAGEELLLEYDDGRKTKLHRPADGMARKLTQLGVKNVEEFTKIELVFNSGFPVEIRLSGYVWI